MPDTSNCWWIQFAVIGCCANCTCMLHEIYYVCWYNKTHVVTAPILKQQAQLKKIPLLVALSTQSSKHTYVSRWHNCNKQISLEGIWALVAIGGNLKKRCFLTKYTCYSHSLCNLWPMFLQWIFFMDQLPNKENSRSEVKNEYNSLLPAV